MSFDFVFEFLISAKMLVALLFGALIGIDREKYGHDAGIRTYAAVAVGATIFSSIAAHIVDDPAATSRIVANIITGVGFLGAGVIFRNGEGSSRGLTTAATLWGTAAVGVAIGLNMFVIGGVASLILYFLIGLHRQTWYIQWKAGLKNNADRS